MRALATLLLVCLLASACASSESIDPTTTSPRDSTTTTSTTTSPGSSDRCPAPTEVVDTRRHDVDGLPPDEIVFLRQVDGSFEVGICDGDTLLASTTLSGTTPRLFGFVDLDDDPTEEILVLDTTSQGHDVVRAARWTPRGLASVDLLLERWIEGDRPEVPDGAFEAAGFECRDIDDDGRLELLSVEYVPAEAVVHLGISRVRLNGTAVTTVGLDSYEIAIQDAHDRWSAEPSCDAADDHETEVRIGDNGWSRVILDEATFQSEGEIVIRALARGGSDDRYVMVGVERKSPLAGVYFEDRPSIWHSLDGLTWSAGSVEAERGEIRDVTALPDGTLIAVGRSGVSTGTAWLSDDGITWTAVTIDAALPDQIAGIQLTDVEAIGDAVFVVGTEAYTSADGASVDLDPALWRSDDAGATWSRVLDEVLGQPGYQPNAGGEFNGELFGLAQTLHGGLVAVGSASEVATPADFPPQRATVWVSEDRAGWERLRVDVDVRLQGVTTVGSTLVAFGSTGAEADGTEDGVILLSTDGRAWSAAGGDFGGLGMPDGVQSILDVVELPDGGVIALGHDDTDFEASGAAAAWWADGSDLMSWTRVGHDDSIFGSRTEPSVMVMASGVADDERTLIAGIDGRAVAVTSDATGCCLAVPAIWIAPDPSEQ